MPRPDWPLRRLGAAALCGAGAACTSLPAAHLYAPEVSGVLLRDGRPVPEARVRLAAQSTPLVQGAITDDRGRFTVGPLTDYRFTIRQFGAARFEYSVQLSLAGEMLAAYSAAGQGEAPRQVFLVCELGPAGAAPQLPATCRLRPPEEPAAVPSG
jgi:hypothetical protein